MSEMIQIQPRTKPKTKHGALRTSWHECPVCHVLYVGLVYSMGCCPSHSTKHMRSVRATMHAITMGEE